LGIQEKNLIFILLKFIEEKQIQDGIKILIVTSYKMEFKHVNTNGEIFVESNVYPMVFILEKL